MQDQGFSPLSSVDSLSSTRMKFPAVSKSPDGEGFSAILQGYLNGVNDSQFTADDQIKKLAAGEVKDLHEVTTAMNEAETSFSLFMEMKNQLVDAYKELNRMQ